MCKKLIYLISFVLLLGLISDASAELVGHWKLDEGSGTTALDASGNGNDGTLYGPQWVAGKYGGALQFDGTDDYVEVPSSPSLEITDAITMTMWVFREVYAGGFERIVAKSDSAGYDYWLQIAGGDPALRFQGGIRDDTGTSHYTWVETPILLNQWTHLAFLYDGTYLKGYVNGQLGKSENIGPFTMQTSTKPLCFGRLGVGGKYYFNFYGLMDDVRIYNHGLSAEEVSESMLEVTPKLASAPFPDDGATDVCPEVVLSWTPGAFVGGLSPKHKVFFSEDFDDVNDGVGGVTQDLDYYPATGTLSLDFGTTYYWRVDEANSTTDWDEGSVWQFTTEPYAYPITVDKITATASSSNLEPQGPENTINSSGLVGDLHSNAYTDMWLSGLESPSGAWIQYEFDKVYKLHEMWVWNYNLYHVTKPGFKNVTIEYSLNGTSWTTLGGVPEFAKAPGADDYAHDITVDFSVAAKYVRITADENWHTGPIPDLDYYGLSEVRFYAIEAAATEPDPESWTAIEGLNVVLSWKQGREAAEHKLYLSTDELAVIGETIDPCIISAAADGCRASYGPLSLDFGETYYWKVNEVNMAEEPNTWEGDVWNFTTLEYLVVDDMDSYGDANTPGEPDGRIFYVWRDGFSVTDPSPMPDNGTASQIGHWPPPGISETIIVRSGKSMPYYYYNDGTHPENPDVYYSEASADTADLPIGSDWTEGGVKSLSLWFYGDPCNDAGATEQMYVKLNGSKVVYDGDLADIQEESWHEWNIDLAAFGGVNLQNVTEISIGFGDEYNTTVPGGSGIVYFDDIRLYSARCILSFRSPDFARVDYVEDCVVDYKELKVMAEDWLTVAPGDDANLVGHWKLDGNADDSSGHNNHGTLYGGPQWVAGKVGSGALDVDGIDDYVDCANDVSLQITGTEITVAAWVKARPKVWWSGIAGKTTSSSWNDGYALFLHGNNTVNFFVTSYTRRAYKWFIPDDQWHHVAGTYDGSNIRIWVDGVEGTPFSYTGSITDSAGPFEIGRIASRDDANVNATLDDVRVYNRALSDVEILGLALRTNLYEDLKIDFKDYAILADKWLDEQLWP